MQRRAVIGVLLSVAVLGLGLSYGQATLGRARDRDRHDAEQERPQTSVTESALGEPAPEALVRGRGRRGPNGARSRTGDGNSVSEIVARSASTSTETSRSGVQAPPSANREAINPGGTPGRVEYKFGRARGFRDALGQCGASSEEASAVITALHGIVDFRRSKPEDRLIFERDESNELRLFEYRAGITEIYRAIRDDDGALRGSRVEVPIEHRRVSKGTFVAGTLGHSLGVLGLGSSLTGIVTGALDAKFSFTKDTRQGDSVRIILDEEYVDGVFLRYGAIHAIEYANERAGKLQAFWFEPVRGTGEFYDASGRAVHGGWLRTPLRYDHISSPYNLKRQHPILKRIMPHLGIDYSASTGTPVWAAADGLVSFAGRRGANGNLVSVRHGHGFESHYAHLWKIGPGIKSGAKVTQRQVLGLVGSTGRSTGPHLHFALKRSGHFLDPATQLNGPGESLSNAELAPFHEHIEKLRAELAEIPLAPAPSVDNTPSTEDLEEDDDLDL
jgi:murein DD-endopeptidase MepM/ murein hydrolase activator NlpD